MTQQPKYVYTFGDQHSEGNAKMKELLGGKGANLAEMGRFGIPVPPGFTITTETCNNYYKIGKEEVIAQLRKQVEHGVHHIESFLGQKFGSPENPLLLSVRSGARVSMPGMMDTVLNLGINEKVVEGLIAKTNNARTAWDSYRRFIQMYGDVVLDLKPKTKEDEDPFEEIIDQIKKEKGVTLDTELSVEDLKELSQRFLKAVEEHTGEPFPTDPWDQLWGAITAVFDSWMNKRAIAYRKLNGIPAEWGTAVNVQAMVFGNMGNTSGTGVAFTRDPATGEDQFVGEYLINAQGEDVVAGIRTPQQITLEGSLRWAQLQQVPEDKRKREFPSMEENMPEAYKELYEAQQKLEDHYQEMQDLEFTVQEGKLWILQTRNGKRTGAAMVKIAMDMMREGRIDEAEVLRRMEPQKLDELLHPVFIPEALESAKKLAKGLPASPGAATGQIVFHADDAEEWARNGKTVILVRQETSPEDIAGMDAAQGILTSRGGMTSHAAVVARGMGTCCVAGAGSISINYKEKTMTVGDHVLKEGDWISLNGSDGQVYADRIETRNPDLSGDFGELMKIAQKHARLKVRTNSDTPHETKVAYGFGARGIGLCRTEHMFFEGERIKAVREMILATEEEDRRNALAKILPMQREDFEGIFKAMPGCPVTIRLLDPPLHEFLPLEKEAQKEMAEDLGVSYEYVHQKVKELEPANPMLGMRGCRLGVIHPEITEMQTRAILEAALNVRNEGFEVIPEIMVPLVSAFAELEMQRNLILKTAEKIFEERGERIDFLVGTMIEIPRAAITADKVAEVSDFFSFGTNDLTQMTYGFSRDDVNEILPIYLEQKILPHDPFQTIDRKGVGFLIETASRLGRQTKPDIKLGICGEHGGDPASIRFCIEQGLDYVSCSPYRVPIAWLVAGQMGVMEKEPA